MVQNRSNRLSTVSSPSAIQSFIAQDLCRPGRKCGLFFILFFSFISPHVFSETIHLKSGKSIQGVIKEKTDKSVLLDVGLQVPVTYYLDEIKEITTDNIQKEAGPLSDTKQADVLEQKGLSLIEEGQAQDGLAALKKAVELSPEANRYLNLGSILFGNGVAAFKKGHKDEAMQVFQDAQAHLKKAVELLDENTQPMLLGQAYFMLGEIQAQGFENKNDARQFYEKSLSFYPNPAVDRAVKQLDQ